MHYLLSSLEHIYSSEFAVFVILQIYHLYFFAVGRESETHPAFDNWLDLTSAAMRFSSRRHVLFLVHAAGTSTENLDRNTWNGYS